MPTTVELQKMFKYSAWPIIYTILAIVIVTLILITLIVARIIKNRREGKKNTIKEIMWVKSDMGSLKQEFLAKLMQIEMEFDADPTKIRLAYERMSNLIRDFVYRATGIEMLKYTLSEIKKTEYHAIADLIEEYYQPEFDKVSAGDVKASIVKTREVITKWN